MTPRFRFSLRLQSLVLLVLITGLLVSTVLFGWSIYQGLYGIIMRGFDEKLFAVSTVTGAFVRGEDHEELYRVRDITAATPAPDGDGLLGIDGRTDELVRIDTEQGGALRMFAVPANGRALAADPDRPRLWVATSEPALYRVDLDTGAAERVGPLDNIPAGMVYDPAVGLLYAGGRGLMAIDPADGRMQEMAIQGIEGAVLAPALESSSNTLYLLDGSSRELLEVDLANASARPVSVLYDAEPQPEDEQLFRVGPPPEMIALAATQGGALFGIADRLARVDPATAAVDSSGTAQGFRSARHPLYQQYVQPMRRISAKRDITYLYTETVELGGRLIYGIDATEGEDHSIIGTAEEIADDEIPAMERAMTQGAVRLSDLEDWGTWGLLKTADAPIYRNDGSVAALASADVDISVVLEKTRVALVQVGMIAAITLLFGVLVSLVISRGLVAPLTEVKEGALQLAAGRYGHRIADQHLVELAELSESFNSMSDALGKTIGELTNTNLALEKVRRRRALEVALADPGYQPDPGPPFLVARSESPEGGVHDPSSYVHIASSRGDRVLVWLADPTQNAPLENLRLRREVAAVARPMLAQHRRDWDAAVKLLADLFPAVHCWVLLDADSRAVHAHARRVVEMAIASADGPTRTIDFRTTPSFVVGARELAVVAAHDAAGAANMIRRDRLGPMLGTESEDAAPAPQGYDRRHVPPFAIAIFGAELIVDAPEEYAAPLSAPVVEVMSR
ncbi:MAG: HAMP domain-containing protein [Gemmatimonadota bacterium]